jgi:DNA-binding XRE family transcriptional regulator
MSPPLHRHEAEPRDLFTSASPASNGRGHSLDKDDQRPTKISVLNCPEGLGQPKRPRVSEQVQVQQRRRPGVGAAVDTFKKRRRRNFENLRNPNEPAATDPVHTRLVFLDLLERDANAPAELRLRQSFCDAPDAHVTRDDKIDGIGGPWRHNSPRASSIAKMQCTVKAVALKPSVRTIASVKRTYKGPLRDTLAKNMRRLRAARGLSQEALAHDSGMNRTYLSAVERAERNVSIDNIARIAKGLRVEPWTLLRDD